MLHGDKHNSSIKIPCVSSYLQKRGYFPSKVTFKYRTLNSNHFILCYEHLLIYLYYISFFKKLTAITCKKLPAKNGTLLCHYPWMNWNFPWQREGTYKRDSYIFFFKFFYVELYKHYLYGFADFTTFCRNIILYIYTEEEQKKKKL